MPRLHRVRPILYTGLFEETVEFYVDILGFSVGEKNSEWQWASLYRDEVEIMISRPNDHVGFTKPLFTGSFYIVTEKVDELWLSLMDKVNICYEPGDFEWGMREFAIYDNNGYVLQFGEEIIDNE